MEPINNLGLNLSAEEIGKGIISNLPPEAAASLHTFINILEAVGIVFLVYLIFLIIKAIFAMKTNARIKKISQNVEEINGKLDSLVKKKIPKSSKR